MKIVAYYRVSTKRQGRSGLGLDAQRLAVEGFGGNVVAEYTEVESGKHADRPQLVAAIQHARSTRARLVIAKLDRLARNVAFVATLMDAGVDFACCDNPHANRLTIHILAAVAEDEARRISERTTAALAAAKRRGVLLGSARRGHWRDREDRRALGSRRGLPRATAARQAATAAAYATVTPMIRAGSRAWPIARRDRGQPELGGPRHHGRAAVHGDGRASPAAAYLGYLPYLCGWRLMASYASRRSHRL